MCEYKSSIGGVGGDVDRDVAGDMEREALGDIRGEVGRGVYGGVCSDVACNVYSGAAFEPIELAMAGSSKHERDVSRHVIVSTPFGAAFGTRAAVFEPSKHERDLSRHIMLPLGTSFGTLGGVVCIGRTGDTRVSVCDKHARAISKHAVCSYRRRFGVYRVTGSFICST